MLEDDIQLSPVQIDLLLNSSIGFEKCCHTKLEIAFQSGFKICFGVFEAI